MMNRLPLPPTRHPVASRASVESQPRSVLASSVQRCPPRLECERPLLFRNSRAALHTWAAA